MSNKYSKWNMAETYTCRNSDVIDIFRGQEMCFFQYKATHVYLLDSYSYMCHSALDKTDIEILIRIVASRVIVAEQLYCYLYIQGVDIGFQELTQRLQVLHSKGMIRKGLVVNGKKSMFINHTYYDSLEFFEPTRVGENFIYTTTKSSIRKKTYEMDWTGITWYEYVRSNIMWNQIVLKLLLENSRIKSFDFQKYQSMSRGDDKRIYIPLIISTINNNYVFEFVRGIEAGKKIIEKKYQQWAKHVWINNKKIKLIFLCENEYHMEMMATYLKNMNREDTLSIYFSYDELWFGRNKGKLKKISEVDGKLVKCKFI